MTTNHLNVALEGSLLEFMHHNVNHLIQGKGTEFIGHKNSNDWSLQSEAKEVRMLTKLIFHGHNDFHLIQTVQSQIFHKMGAYHELWKESKHCKYRGFQMCTKKNTHMESLESSSLIDQRSLQESSNKKNISPIFHQPVESVPALRAIISF